MKNLTWQNPEQLFVAQVLINKVKSKCCGIKGEDEKEDERLKKIEKIINDMPDKTKFVVDQCYLEGRKYVEVAEMMSISREGVRKHITKALNILRSAFNVEKK